MKEGEPHYRTQFGGEENEGRSEYIERTNFKTYGLLDIYERVSKAEQKQIRDDLLEIKAQNSKLDADEIGQLLVKKLALRYPELKRRLESTDR